jgi:hypothetical protein
MEKKETITGSFTSEHDAGNQKALRLGGVRSGIGENQMRKHGVGSVGSAIGMIALTLICTQSKSASAAPKQSLITDFYSDATHTTQVGERQISCEYPFVYMTGQSSAYPVTYDVQNCDGTTAVKPETDELSLFDDLVPLEANDNQLSVDSVE